MTDLINFLALVMPGLYAALTLALAAGIVRAGRASAGPGDDLPSVSILVAARNEAVRLPLLLDSLANLAYPDEKLEIFVIDDQSTDSTAEIVKIRSRRMPHLRLLQPEEQIAGLNGKANALHAGILASSGDIVLITDADCTVPREWARKHACLYAKKRVGMVGGFVIPELSPGRRGLFERMQAVDWFYLCAVGSGAAGLGKPQSIFGNNFSFRREAYHACGGFPGAGFSVIEDFALMQRFLACGWMIQLVAESGLALHTEPAPSFAAFRQQRLRWALGSRQLSSVGLLLMAVGFGTRVLPWGLILAGEYALALAALLVPAGADLLLLRTAAARLRRSAMVGETLLYPLFALLYALLLLPAYLFGAKVRWKDRTYNVRKG